MSKRRAMSVESFLAWKRAGQKLDATFRLLVEDRGPALDVTRRQMTSSERAAEGRHLPDLEPNRTVCAKIKWRSSRA